MITTQTSEKQTGAFSRIQQPFAPLAPERIRARTERRRVQPPMRNMLAGSRPGPRSPAGWIYAWLRGEL